MEDKYSLKMTKAASEDYEAVYLYIADELLAQQAADSMIDKLQEGIQRLQEMPLIGSYVRDDYLRSKGYRRLSVGNYSIFYLVYEKERVLYVMRILYNGRDYMNLL